MIFRLETWRDFRRRARDISEPSSKWREAGWAFGGLGIPTLGLDPLVGAFCCLIAGICFLAHRDMTRRRKKQWEALIDEMEAATVEYELGET